MWEKQNDIELENNWWKNESTTKKEMLSVLVWNVDRLEKIEPIFLSRIDRIKKIVWDDWEDNFLDDWLLDVIEKLFSKSFYNINTKKRYLQFQNSKLSFVFDWNSEIILFKRINNKNKQL
jgi:hypothetical protein